MATPVNTSAFVVTNQKDEPITSGLLVIRPESAISSGSFFDTMVSEEFAVECRLF